jgi:hypothetical protein
MRIRYLLTLFLLCCLACNNIKESDKAKSETKNTIEFDRIKWEKKHDKDYPYRDKMLNDLMTNYELQGVKKDSLVKLLGSPDRIDSSYLFYRIAQKRLGFFPLHTTTLVIKLANDSTVKWVRIHK